MAPQSGVSTSQRRFRICSLTSVEASITAGSAASAGDLLIVLALDFGDACVRREACCCRVDSTQLSWLRQGSPASHALLVLRATATTTSIINLHCSVCVSAAQHALLTMPSDRGTTHLDDVSPSESFASNLGLLFSKVREKNADSDWRDLHALEKHTLALNELAVAQGAGFFMFLPNRDSLKSFPKDERLPLSRRFESPG